VNSVTLPWPPKELNPNAKCKLRAKMRAKKAYRQECWALTLEAGLRAPADRILLHLDFYPPDNRTRDDDNMIASFKHGRDGVALAMKIDDKRFRTVPMVRDVRKGGAIVVTLEAL